MFERFFARSPTPANPVAQDASIEGKGGHLSPHPTEPDQWARVSSAEWLTPDVISQKESRIAKHPQYYDWCRELADTLFKKHPGLIVQPVVPVKATKDPWARFFSSAVARWILLLPPGIPDQQHYCNCLAVCLNLAGYDTNEEIEDFLAKRHPTNTDSPENPDTRSLSIYDFIGTSRNYQAEQARLWIRAVPVLRATRNRTFLRGKPMDCCDDGDEPCFIHNLRAINPRTLPPMPTGRWNDGHIAWLDTSSFLSFLSHWTAATPISAADVAHGEPVPATDQDSWLASGFAELCRACGNTYYDSCEPSCSVCGCRADDPDVIEQYASSKKHAEWVLGDLKKGVALEIQQLEEARRRDEEERLQQQRKLFLEQKQAEERNRERLRAERAKQDASAQMARATEKIAVLRRRLADVGLEVGQPGDRTREASLRQLRDAIAEYENARESYEKWQASSDAGSRDEA